MTMRPPQSGSPASAAGSFVQLTAMKTMSARAGFDRGAELTDQFFQRVWAAAVRDGRLDADARQRPSNGCADGARSDDADGHVLIPIRLEVEQRSAPKPRTELFKSDLAWPA